MGYPSFAWEGNAGLRIGPPVTLVGSGARRAARARLRVARSTRNCLASSRVTSFIWPTASPFGPSLDPDVTGRAAALRESIADAVRLISRAKPAAPDRRGRLNIAIVGGGAAGLFTSLMLTRAGHEVVVLEKVKMEPPSRRKCRHPCPTGQPGPGPRTAASEH